MTKTFSTKTKQKLVQRYQDGESIKSISSEFHIAKSTLYYWVKLHQAQTTRAGVVVTPKEFDSMKRRLHKLESIVAVLKTADCLPSAPLRQKLEALELLHGQYNIHVLCEALDVSRGTMYNHLLRNKRNGAAFVKRRESLMKEIQQIYDESNQIFGAGKIRAVLMNRGHKVSEKTVSSLMKTMGIRSMRDDSKREWRLQGWEHRKSNLLKQKFDVNQPNKVWVSDITCYKLKNTYFYICVFIDLFSRRVLSLTIGRNNSTNLVRRALDTAYKNRRPESIIIHTDRGTPYTSYTMRNLTRKYNMSQSFSYAGKPHDNAVMESFFASIKKEELYRVRYKSEAEFRLSLEKYIHFYNSIRPHKYLNYQTPDQTESGFCNIPIITNKNT